VKLAIKYFEAIGQAPLNVSALAVRILYEIIEEALTSPESVSLYPNNHVLVAYDGGEPVGLITFDKQHDDRYWVWLGGVDHKYRRRGVYHQLWSELVERAKKNGVGAIEGASSPNNHGMECFNAKHGRRAKCITYIFRV
jgi:GNAT superfamily N-acetyltransferase